MNETPVIERRLGRPKKRSPRGPQYDKVSVFLPPRPRDRARRGDGCPGDGQPQRSHSAGLPQLPEAGGKAAG